MFITRVGMARKRKMAAMKNEAASAKIKIWLCRAKARAVAWRKRRKMEAISFAASTTLKAGMDGIMASSQQ